MGPEKTPLNCRADFRLLRHDAMVTEGLARRNGLDQFPETRAVPDRG